ncbi:ribosome biogenesis protein BOP1 homolog [Megalops cyprinoides]|uniref:ribosome biogenesis protein BOP1 homolog n=1 Tax=Megalops cyprinoides TaxID=118141 RepID=UPI0018652752|nr:ribosome biogenesis protein BOP1 homolog [Megalops cyprinoides]
MAVWESPVTRDPSVASAPKAAVALEMSCPPAGPVQGECCGGCHPQPLLTPPLMPNPTREDPCPATDGLMEEIGSQDSAMELPVGDRKGERLPFQIFPDPVEVVGTEGSLSCPQERERLPSIVVEPTDVSEVESGELRWPPEDMDFEDEEDLFLEQCIPPANIADWGDDEDEEEEEEEGEEDDDSADLQSDEEFRDSSSTLLHDSAPALN